MNASLRCPVLLEVLSCSLKITNGRFSEQVFPRVLVHGVQDNVALIAVLEASEAPGKSQNRERRQLVCVANTHVHSNPELTDVKLWQVQFAFHVLNVIINVYFWGRDAYGILAQGAVI